MNGSVIRRVKKKRKDEGKEMKREITDTHDAAPKLSSLITVQVHNEVEGANRVKHVEKPERCP